VASCKAQEVEPAAAENSSDSLIEKYHQSTRHELAIFHHDSLETRKLIFTADRWALLTGRRKHIK
jgi:hypothetical protein